jgi:hypothetical protein
VITDGGVTIQLTLYAETGAVTAVGSIRSRAILASKLINAAATKLA